MRILRVVAALLLLVLMLRIAWIGDDALITLRAALNLTHGWGPGFNAFEAVQSSTHPLWFLLWMALGSVTGDWIVPILVLSTIMAAGAVYLVLQRVHSAPAIIAVAGSLALSNAFMEYSSSGLENPLAYLLVAILILLTTRIAPMSAVVAVLIGGTTAALVLTRFDLVALVAPLAVVLLWRERRQLRTIALAAGAFLVPVFVWLAWSWVTYATLVPNTLAAKQNSSIPRIEFLVQGIRYVWISVEHDPVTLLILIAGIVGAVVTRNVVLRAWMVGALLYLSYVVWIGGDFMAGRFLAVPTFVAAGIAGIVLGERPVAFPGRDAVLTGIGVVGVALLMVGMGIPPTSVNPPASPRWDFGSAAGVSDEYGYHLQFSRDLRQVVMGLGKPLSVPPFQTADALDPAVTLSDLRSAAASWPSAPIEGPGLPSAVVPQYGFLGTVGVLTGPTVHLVDRYALTDRFLSDIEYQAPPFQWRPGHFDRAIPDGYVEAITTSDPSAIPDPFLQARLRTLWDSIR